MKKIIVSAFAAVCVVLLSSCSWNMKSNVDTKVDVPQAENTMMRDNSAMMKKDDVTPDDIMKVELKADGDAMMQK